MKMVTLAVCILVQPALYSELPNYVDEFAPDEQRHTRPPPPLLNGKSLIGICACPRPPMRERPYKYDGRASIALKGIARVVIVSL